jgi:hypothetical protein
MVIYSLYKSSVFFFFWAIFLGRWTRDHYPQYDFAKFGGKINRSLLGRYRYKVGIALGPYRSGRGLTSLEGSLPEFGLV